MEGIECGDWKEMSENEILKFALENGMVDIPHVRKLMEKKKREEQLAKHTHKIWQGKDGKWRTYAVENGKRKMLKRNTQKEIEDCVLAGIREKEDNPTIRDVFTEWNDTRLAMRKIAESSHYRYLMDFRRYYGEFGERKIKTVQPDEIEDFLDRQILEQNLSKKAFSGLLIITKGTLKRAKKKRYINFPVTELFQDMDITDAEFKDNRKDDFLEVFDEDETERIKEYLVRNFDTKNAGLLLLFVTGIRIGELVALKPEDIGENSVRICATETSYRDSEGKMVYEIKERAKTRAGERTVYVPDNCKDLLLAIKALNPDCEYVFSDAQGNRLKTYQIRKRLRKVCNKLGIQKKSPHKIRKTYATILLDSGADKNMVTAQMGHTDIGTTENFYHKDRKTAAEKVMALNAINEICAKAPKRYSEHTF